MNNNRFAVAVHILSLLELMKDTRLTSEYIAGSVNTNAVVIRRIMGMLSKAGLVLTSPGVAGASLSRPTDQITLLDIYRAVQSGGQEELFAIHDKPNPDCSVGRNIQSSLENVFSQAQLALENKLSALTLDQVTTDLASKM
ncbi:Rrf2 family transcriptional regulator [Paenibacillus radicis (ex Gao et al. 2016)]|uniref:Rrf2 family transcriptional regulator n=1 Tax=Paenibacillus radicis (ex Gao et al. 2016) TaxID=1737354 RepID=A0A917HQ72_9BACL|nr:Rrf2 family transcriptional regulator [Paenibacillus radicis (ex Gao et al. 2016)]GGG85868.1 Rrf2 family transcriptional regulator [Paenibacillus radicis (ex Gao et al. 2016)]